MVGFNVEIVLVSIKFVFVVFIDITNCELFKVNFFWRFVLVVFLLLTVLDLVVLDGFFVVFMVSKEAPSLFFIAVLIVSKTSPESVSSLLLNFFSFSFSSYSCNFLKFSIILSTFFGSLYRFHSSACSSFSTGSS
uniref:Uncharacterized protein n=1 Tax=Cacopsylla melanoneura TaxID=428564 RepID=A0A8D9F268_9HEMI